LDGDSLWLKGSNRQFGKEDNRLLATFKGQWGAQFAEHIYYCTKKANEKSLTY
jgi:hypothetical protein